MAFLKKIFLWGVIGAIIYGFLSFHIIFFNWSDINLLRKSRLTLRYTFYMAGGKSNKTIMKTDTLRRDGIGDLLVAKGKMTEQERDSLMDRFGKEDE